MTKLCNGVGERKKTGRFCYYERQDDRQHHPAAPPRIRRGLYFVLPSVLDQRRLPLRSIIRSLANMVFVVKHILQLFLKTPLSVLLGTYAAFFL
jgi:hypothetical protein